MFFEQFGPAEIFESCSDKNRNLCLFLIKLGKESLPSLQTVVGTVAVLFLAWAGVHNCRKLLAGLGLGHV